MRCAASSIAKAVGLDCSRRLPALRRPSRAALFRTSHRRRQPCLTDVEMSDVQKLQITLYVVAAYLALFGILFVFAPGVFERITQTTLPDAKLTPLYGVHTLI